MRLEYGMPDGEGDGDDEVDEVSIAAPRGGLAAVLSIETDVWIEREQAAWSASTLDVGW